MKSLLLFPMSKWVDYHLKINTILLLQPCHWWTHPWCGITKEIRKGGCLSIDELCINGFFFFFPFLFFLLWSSFVGVKVRLKPYFNGFRSHWRCYIEIIVKEAEWISIWYDKDNGWSLSPSSFFFTNKSMWSFAFIFWSFIW